MFVGSELVSLCAFKAKLCSSQLVRMIGLPRGACEAHSAWGEGGLNGKIHP